MYIIGIVDDNTSEVDDIQATIFSAWKNIPEITEDVEFILYPVAPDPDIRQKTVDIILKDIDEYHIHGLIVDYKLDSLRRVMLGKDVIKDVLGAVPAFPGILLTNAADQGKHAEEIDPDKVYDKAVFFQADSDQSKEMALNIYLNIKRYTNRRLELESKLSVALDQMSKDSSDAVDVDLLSQISAIEYELSNYRRNGQSRIEKDLDMSELRDILHEIEELKKEV